MKTMLKTISLSASIAALAVSAATAESAEDFFCSLNEMRIIVSYSPGGGYDTFGRMVSDYMSRYIPCEPSFVVQNMPGGGGARAGNYLYNTAPADGSTISIISRGILTAPMIYGAGSETQFNGEEFRWLGSLVEETGVGMVTKTSPFQSLDDDDISGQAFFGAAGVETLPAMYTRMLNSLLGTNIKVITGYAGQTEYYMAMEQGELDGTFMSGWSGPNRLQAMEARDRGEVKFLVQMARERNEEVGLDVPTIYEIVKDESHYQVLDVLLAPLVLGRPFIAPPGVPEDRMKILRDAFEQAVTDPEFIAEADQRNFNISPIFGLESEEIMAAVYATPEELLDQVRDIVITDD